MPDNFQQQASRIMLDCSRILQQPYQQNRPHYQTKIQPYNKLHVQNRALVQNSNQASPFLQKDMSNNLFNATVNSVLSPHEQSQNNKIIEKIRRKASRKKLSRQIFIRKTDLGESQLIFTKQQLEKLKIIDQQENQGRNYDHQPATIKKQTPESPQLLIQATINPLSKALVKQVDKKYFPPAIVDNPHEEILKNLAWIDLNDVKNSKRRNKNKILNFQKRQKSPFNQLQIPQRSPFNQQQIVSSQQKSLFNQHQIVSYEQKKTPLPLLLCKNSCPNYGFKSLQLSKAKSCHPLIKKNSVDKGFLSSLNQKDNRLGRKMSDKQKMEQIVFRVHNKLQKQLSGSNASKKYIYMTQQRKQAIFECEMLRRIKSQLGPKFYNNLQLGYGIKQKQLKTQENQADQNKQNIQGSNFSLHHGQGPFSLKNQINRPFCVGKQKHIAESQAQKMIHKNKNRLKEQRKRVIQKMMC